MPPTGFSPLPARGSCAVAVAAQLVILPFPPGTRGTLKGKSGRRFRKGGGFGCGESGGDGSSQPPPPSHRALLATSRFNGLTQEEQQHLQPVQGGPTCERCTVAGRNLKHHHRSCVVPTWSRCKRVGHRSSVCPYW